jgi:hypothetical protein
MFTTLIFFIKVYNTVKYKSYGSFQTTARKYWNLANLYYSYLRQRVHHYRDINYTPAMLNQQRTI